MYIKKKGTSSYFETCIQKLKKEKKKEEVKLKVKTISTKNVNDL